MLIEQQAQKFHDAIQVFVRNGFTFKEAVREFQYRYINLTLAECRGNQTQAAKRLGMHRNSLRRYVTACRKAGRLTVGLRGPGHLKREARAQRLQKLVDPRSPRSAA